MASIRDAIVERLRQLAGPDVHVVEVERATDILDRRTIVVKQTTIRRMPEAPNAGVRIDYVLSFISPAVDPEIAEPDLDEWVPEILADLNRANWLSWTLGTKALYGNANLCYDVDAFALTTPTNTDRKE